VDLGLKGKVALVTAASRGLGRAVATELAREGAKVVISSRDEETLASTAAKVGEETGGEVGYFPADLSSEGDVKALVSHTAGSASAVSIYSSIIPVARLLGDSMTSETRRGGKPSSRS
jgi:3-oxoacyl-[acyl-carrier protein] reductase